MTGGRVDGRHQAPGLLTFPFCSWVGPTHPVTRPLDPGVAQVTKAAKPLGPRTTLSRATAGTGSEDQGWSEPAAPAVGHPLEAQTSVHAPWEDRGPLFVHRVHLTQPPTSPTACSGNLRSSRVGAVVRTPGSQVPRPGDRPGRARKPQDGRSSPDFRESKQHTCSVPEGAIPSLFLVLGLAARSGSPSRSDETKSAGRQCWF